MRSFKYCLLLAGTSLLWVVVMGNPPALAHSVRPVVEEECPDRPDVPSAMAELSHILFAQPWISPIYMDDSRVAFIQPDGSFTLLALESGTVLARTRDAIFEKDRELFNKFDVVRWTRTGEVLYGVQKRRYYYGHSPTAPIFRLDTGEHLQTVAWPFIGEPEGFLIYKWSCSLDILNTNTLAVSSFGRESSLFGAPFLFHVEAENCFFMEYGREKFSCHSFPDMGEKWSVTPAEGENVLGFVIIADQVHLFSGTHDWAIEQCTSVTVYDFKGNVITHRSDSAMPEIVPGNSFTTWFTYNGTPYYGPFPTHDVFPIFHPDYTKEPRGEVSDPGDLHGMDSLFAVLQIEEGAQAWLGRRDDGEVVLRYRDGETAWEGTVGTMEDWKRFMALGGTMWDHTAFRIGANDECIVYATPAGRMECMERATGKSRWIYVYSGMSLGVAERHPTGKSDMDRTVGEAHARSLSIANIAPLRSTATEGADVPNLVIDPYPEKIYPLPQKPPTSSWYDSFIWW